MAREKEKLELLFKDFRLEQITFELRYNHEQYYPAKFQQFWREIQNQLTGQFKPLREQEVTVVNYDNKFEFQVSADRFAIIQFYPDSLLKELSEVSGVFYDAVIKVFEIEEIIRVGLRLIYSKNYENSVSVAEALYKTPYINCPDNLYLIDKGVPLIPTLAIGWRGEEKGITYRLKGNSGSIGLDLPLQMVATGDYPEHIEKVYNQVILDIDIYVHKPILPGQFFSGEWIKQAYDTVKKEGSKFFGVK